MHVEAGNHTWIRKPLTGELLRMRAESIGEWGGREGAGGVGRLGLPLPIWR